MNQQAKPWLPIDDQIMLLSDRGMNITDANYAAHLLSSVGYYRLSGYWYPYRKKDPSRHGRRLSQFCEGTELEEVEALYSFDRELKLLLLAGIERIEVALRARVGYVLGEHGPLCYESPSSFRPSFKHAKWLRTIEGRVNRARGRDDFIDHHDEHYNGKIPIWVLTDVLDFADISILYASMNNADQKAVADWVHVTMLPDASRSARQRWARNPPLANWLEHLTVVRNICAHHSRLWNRQLPPVGTSARIRHLDVFKELPEDQHQVERVFGTICIVAYLLRTISPGNTWRDEVDNLIRRGFAQLPHRTVTEMGISSAI